MHLGKLLLRVFSALYVWSGMADVVIGKWSGADCVRIIVEDGKLMYGRLTLLM